MGVIFEISRVSNALRCAAVDEETSVEVVVFGPLGVGEGNLRSLALNKLLWKLGQKPHPNEDTLPPTSAKGHWR